VRCLLILLTLLVNAPAFAVQPDEILKDPVLESRARTLSQELRCMVCQNQSIDDSDAPLAKDLRILVRARPSAGGSNGPVIGSLVERYGESVLLKPRMNAHTVLLWVAPFAVLVIAALAFFLAGRRKTPATADGSSLSAEEEARIEALLKRE